MSIFSVRLEHQRQLRGWSKSFTAKKLDISPQRYANWEYDTRQPNLQMLNQIASLFNVSADYLIGLTNDYRPKRKRKRKRHYCFTRQQMTVIQLLADREIKKEVNKLINEIGSDDLDGTAKSESF